MQTATLKNVLENSVLSGIRFQTNRLAPTTYIEVKQYDRNEYVMSV